MHAPLEHLIDQVRNAAASGVALCIRGGGSKDFLGSSGHGADEVLDTRAWTGIVSYEPSELVVTVRAGTPLAELEAVLARQGQCLPFEPPHFSLVPGSGPATVGGMVSAGLSGPARASAGCVRDYVLGAQLLNGRAELLQFGGQVMKNVAGYDVSRVLAGAMGTLGVLTEVSLKVLPVAPAEATLVFELPQAEALEHLHRWGAQPLPLNASCWVRDTTSGTPRELLFVRLRGALAAVGAASKRLLAELPGQGMDTAVAGPDWQACRDLRLPFFAAPRARGEALWRLSVAQTAPVLALPGPALVEWHGGLRWVWAAPSEAHHLRTLAQSAGGHATLFWAPDADDAMPGIAGLRHTPVLPALAAIHRRLKAEFDPAGVFNPGRVF